MVRLFGGNGRETLGFFLDLLCDDWWILVLRNSVDLLCVRFLHWLTPLFVWVLAMFVEYCIGVILYRVAHLIHFFCRCSGFVSFTVDVIQPPSFFPGRFSFFSSQVCGCFWFILFAMKHWLLLRSTSSIVGYFTTFIWENINNILSNSASIFLSPCNQQIISSSLQVFVRQANKFVESVDSSVLYFHLKQVCDFDNSFLCSSLRRTNCNFFLA